MSTKKNLATPSVKKEKKNGCTTTKSASTHKGEPQRIGEVLDEYFQSNEPLAVAFRNWKAKQDKHKKAEVRSLEERLFKDLFPNTEMDVCLKLITRRAGRMRLGQYLDGAITRDGKTHYTFIQNATDKKMVARRNPIVYKGVRINVHRNREGRLLLSFCRPQYTSQFTFRHLCQEAAEELLAVAGLVEEKVSE